MTTATADKPATETPTTDLLDYFDGHVETMPRNDLERLQEARLMRLVEHAHAHVPLITEVPMSTAFVAALTSVVVSDSASAFSTGYGSPVSSA